MTNKVTFDHDGMVERDRESRWLVLIISFTILILFPTWVGIKIGGIISFTDSWKFFGVTGLCVGLYTTLELFHRFWVVVPQTSAFVTINLFASKTTNPNVPYGPGGHPTFPWESRDESGNISLDIMTASFHEKIATKDAAVIVDGNVQFKFSLGHITTVVGVDEDTIRHGFVDQMNEWFTERLCNKTGEEAKNSVKVLHNELEEEFEGDDPKSKKQMLLEEYGVVVTGFQISSIDFEPEVQRTRDAIEEIARIGDGVWKIMGFNSKNEFKKARASGKITENDISRARDDFLAASGNVKKEVRRIDVTGAESLGGAVMAGLVGGGKV